MISTDAEPGSSGHSPDREREFAGRLQRGEPDAVLELFDDLAPLVYGFALRRTRSKDRAITAIRRAFVRACENPEMFADPRLPVRSRMFLEVHHFVLLGMTERRPSRPGRKSSRRVLTRIAFEDRAIANPCSFELLHRNQIP